MNTQFNGDRLKKARIYRGLTVADLAERVGCQRQTLSMYEISKSQPTDKTTVVRLAQALDFPINTFMNLPAQLLPEQSISVLYSRQIRSTVVNKLSKWTIFRRFTLCCKTMYHFPNLFISTYLIIYPLNKQLMP